MNRTEAHDILLELTACWKESDSSDTGRVLLLMQAIGFEFGLYFTLNYPEYAVALRNALNNGPKGDGSKERFLRVASDIIAAHPMEAEVWPA